MPVVARQRIQSLDRGLQILEYVADKTRPARLAELAELLGVEKSSAHRLVKTLQDRGYVRQDPQTMGYLLHDRIFSLASKLASHMQIHQCAHKYLQRLAGESGETAHLAVRGAGAVVFIDHEFGSHAVGVTTRWGSSEPFHCTALGKALLAGMTRDELKVALGDAPLKRYTRNTITTLSQLADQCVQAERDGVAYDLCEYHDNMNCIGSPIRDFRGKIIAAIGISGPIERMEGQVLKKAAAMVKQNADELSGELGYRQ